VQPLEDTQRHRHTPDDPGRRIGARNQPGPARHRNTHRPHDKTTTSTSKHHTTKEHQDQTTRTTRHRPHSPPSKNTPKINTSSNTTKQHVKVNRRALMQLVDVGPVKIN